MTELTAKEAKELIQRVGDCVRHKDYDLTYGPEFPKDRKDVCVVKHMTENGRDYGYDQIFIVWKAVDGTTRYKELVNSRSTKDYLQIYSIESNADDSVSVKLGSADGYRGYFIISLPDGEISKESPKSLQDIIQLKLSQLVASHIHSHPQYEPTSIKELVINKETSSAVCILFEQIDTDGGFKGNQFRYSLWKIGQEKEPVQLYEDHAYINDRPTLLTGGKSRGRNCILKNLRVEDKEIKILHSKGEVENEEWEELKFPI